MQAIRAGRSDTSKVSTLRAPLSPASNRFHVTSTPQPSGVTIPKPVTTTRLMGPPAWPADSFLLLRELTLRNHPGCERHGPAGASGDDVQNGRGVRNAPISGSLGTGNRNIPIPPQIL